jgi:hypothetical protein
MLKWRANASISSLWKFNCHYPINTLTRTMLKSAQTFPLQMFWQSHHAQEPQKSVSFGPRTTTVIPFRFVQEATHSSLQTMELTRNPPSVAWKIMWNMEHHDNTTIFAHEVSHGGLSAVPCSHTAFGTKAFPPGTGFCVSVCGDLQDPAILTWVVR